jgi:hypothetical protein
LRLEDVQPDDPWQDHNRHDQDNDHSEDHISELFHAKSSCPQVASSGVRAGGRAQIVGGAERLPSIVTMTISWLNRNT